MQETPKLIKTITVDLLRHGEPQGGDVLRGRIDHPLSELGWRQMQVSAAMLAGVIDPPTSNDLFASSSNSSNTSSSSSRFSDSTSSHRFIDSEPPAFTAPWTHIITSPLQRCRSFAEQLHLTHQIPLQVIEDWQEIDYGEWDGMPLDQWRKVAAPQFKAFRTDLSKLHPPKGENFLAFKNRVLAAWQDIAMLPHGSHVLIVSHGGVLRVILPTVVGVALNDGRRFSLPFACVSRVGLRVYAGVVEEDLVFHGGEVGFRSEK